MDNETKALRIFYRKGTNEIVWTHMVVDFMGRPNPVFPTTLAKDLKDLPNKKPDGEHLLGGNSSDYESIEELNIDKINSFSNKSKILNGVLV